MKSLEEPCSVLMLIDDRENQASLKEEEENRGHRPLSWQGVYSSSQSSQPSPTDGAVDCCTADVILPLSAVALLFVMK